MLKVIPAKNKEISSNCNSKSDFSNQFILSFSDKLTLVLKKSSCTSEIAGYLPLSDIYIFSTTVDKCAGINISSIPSDEISDKKELSEPYTPTIV